MGGHIIQKSKPCTEMQDPAECLQDSLAAGHAPWVHSSPRHHEHCLNHATLHNGASPTEKHKEAKWGWLRAAHDFLFDELPEVRPSPQDVVLLPEPSPSEQMPAQPKLQAPQRIGAMSRALQFADGPEVREYDPQAAVLGEVPCKGQMRNTASTEKVDVERPLEDLDDPKDHQRPPSIFAASPVISKFALRVTNSRKPLEPSCSYSTRALSPMASKFAMRVATARMPAAEEVQPSAPTPITRCSL